MIACTSARATLVHPAGGKLFYFFVFRLYGNRNLRSGKSARVPKTDDDDDDDDDDAYTEVLLRKSKPTFPTLAQLQSNYPSFFVAKSFHEVNLYPFSGPTTGLLRAYLKIPYQKYRSDSVETDLTELHDIFMLQYNAKSYMVIYLIFHLSSADLRLEVREVHIYINIYFLIATSAVLSVQYISRSCVKKGIWNRRDYC